MLEKFKRSTYSYTSYLWLVVVITYPTLGCLAQQDLSLPSVEVALRFNHLTREDGLPDDAVTEIFQDSRGFMWFGTGDGLVRYDGYELKVYKNDPNDPQSLSSNRVTAIYEDRAEILWIGTTIGLNKYDRSQESFKSYLSDAADSLKLNDNYIMSIFEDQQGLFWVGTQSGGLNLMDRVTETFRHYLPDPGMKYGYVSNAITGIVEDAARPGVLWVGTIMNRDIWVQFNTANRAFSFYPESMDEGKQELARGQINTVYKSKTDQIWLGTADGLDLFVPEKKSFVTYNHLPDDSSSLSHNLVLALFEDSGHTLWVGTLGGGLNKFNPVSQSFDRYRHNPYDLKSLASDQISAIFEDRSGILWVGTIDAGISYVDRSAQKFVTITPNADPPAARNGVSAIYQDRAEALWVGTPYDGLVFFNEKTNEFQHFRDEPGELQMLSKPWVWSILEDRQGILWIGMNRDGLYRFDRKKQTVKIYKNDPGDPKTLINDYVPAICERRNGSLWIATNGGLQRLDRETDSFQTISLLKEGPQNLLIGCLYEDHVENLWVGSGAGLFCLDSAGRVLRHFYHDREDVHSLSSNVIFCITEDAGHHIWVGTNKGINKITLTGKVPVIKRYTETDGLAGNNISGILEDARGQLWISTSNGLSLFRNPRHDEQSLPDFHTYGIKDGLQAYRFNAGAFFKNAAGELIFGGLGGLNRFYPDSIQRNSFQPPLVITSFTFYDMDAPEQGAVAIPGISEKQAITLSYKDNIFSIGFAALSFRESHLNKYAYQLEGFNDNWILLGTDHQVTFTNLDPGAYTFRVKGSNNDGIWNETPAELKIVITSPWWKTGWAYFLYALALLLAAYFWRRYELNRRQLKHDLKIRQIEAEKLQELDQMKSRFFANISHEFRTPLTLILGPLDKLMSATGEKENIPLFTLMERNAQRLLRLINQLLDISKLEAGKMTLETRQKDIIPTIKGMFYAFESMAKHKGVSQHFETEVETARLYFDPDKLEQIITNVLSNAFKFTAEGGAVTVNIREVQPEGSARFLQIDISDTGTGIPAERLPYVFDRFYQATDRYNKDEQGSGIGLALAKELVELHHGRIGVSSELGRGTRFTILLPFGKDHLQPEALVEQPEEDYLLTGQVRLPDSEPGNVILPPESGSAVLPLIKASQEESTKPTVVLLVEDNTDMRTFIHSQLSGIYQVIEAVDGQEGLEKAFESIPDLVISDVMMPRMDGLELCDALKNDERTSHIPVILLTAKADIASRLAGLERGADVYLAKPFKQEELLLWLRKLLELRRRLQERYTTLQPPPAEDKGQQIEDAFLQKIRQLVEQDLSAPDLDMGQLSQLLAMSRSQVFRKVKALTGLSPTLYVRSIRLQRAKELLQTTNLSVSEIAYQVGFSTLAYFSDAFLEAFGKRPSDLRR